MNNSFMNLSTYNEFIYDKSFSADLHVKYPKVNEIIEKNTFLKELIKNKKIIDLGFADHYELIERRLKEGNWVHANFRDWSSKIIGIDVDEKAVEYVKKKFNYSDVFCHDITNTELMQPILDEQWDYIVMSEVLEHISNPSLFLSRIKANYRNNVKKIIITVPNAFGAITLRSLFKNIERINSDHKFWFTPYTLAKVVVAAGLEIEQFCLCNSYYKLNFWERLLIKRSPLFHHTLAMVVKL